MQTSMPPREAIHYARSRKGNCWEREAYPLGCNAPMESFFGTLKNESLHHYRFATREQARRVVFEYIEVFYNRIRRHAKIGNNSPAEYANSFYAKSFKDAA
jgi:putative transposase